MTPAQKRVLLIIANYWKAHGYSPSYQEIADAAELKSLSTVYKHIQALLARDYLKQDETQLGNSRYRSLQLTPKFSKLSTTCPLCGGHLAPPAVSN